MWEKWRGYWTTPLPPGWIIVCTRLLNHIYIYIIYVFDGKYWKHQLLIQEHFCDTEQVKSIWISAASSSACNADQSAFLLLHLLHFTGNWVSYRSSLAWLLPLPLMPGLMRFTWRPSWQRPCPNTGYWLRRWGLGLCWRLDPLPGTAVQAIALCVPHIQHTPL